MTVNWKSRWLVPGGLIAAGLMVAGGAWVRADVSGSKAAMQDMTPAQQAAINSAVDLSTAFRTVSTALLPTVVAIENRPQLTHQISGGPAANDALPEDEGLDRRHPFAGTPFEDMFRDFQYRSPRQGVPSMPFGTPMPNRGIGSGVIIDASGIVLTNNHVVEGGGEVIVRTHDGREFAAVDVWTDPKTDLAVVRIENAEDLIAAPLGNSDESSIGDWVLALGQPFGLESTVTAGIISAKHRDLGITDRENFLQTDAAINPGNSGGPLVNMRGEVIGINTAIHSRSGGNEGIGFAVPSNLARWVSRQLVDEGKVRRAYLGVGIQPVTGQLAGELAVKPRSGVAVTKVMEGTPAAEAGLQEGDVIVRIAGQVVKTPQALQLAVERSPIGDRVELQVVRGGETIDLTYQAAEMETPNS